MKNLKSKLSRYLTENENVDDDVWDDQIGEEINTTREERKQTKRRDQHDRWSKTSE